MMPDLVRGEGDAPRDSVDVGDAIEVGDEVKEIEEVGVSESGEGDAPNESVEVAEVVAVGVPEGVGGQPSQPASTSGLG